ncbi:MAG TPA: 16S rRNA (cytosine(1402)-N(4))-methyltransferase RsmH, partial [Anaerolineaceae bacterium]
PHRSVLYQQIINALGPQSPGRYVDATVGAGGHAWGILNASAPNGRLLGLDLDPQALEIARQRLAEFSDRATLVQASYTTLGEQIDQMGWEAVQGIVIDLGVSSMQLDQPERGFSFQADGPLDMRFDPGQPLSADTLVNEWSERDLADLIWRYGEEQQSRRVARAIVRERPLHTTRALAEVISRAMGGRKGGHVHPATRTFQALRIVVNGELQSIEDVLPQAIAALAPGGRLAVISFHSLEDRIVKQFFRRESRDCICPPEQPVCTCGHKASLIEINRHPVEAEPEEIESNPRARSARLRIAEKIHS